MASMCAACGRPGHRYGRNEGMERFDPVACINGLLQEVEQLKRDDMYRRGWGDAVATVMAALEDGRGEPVGVPYAALEGSEGGEDGW